MEGHNESCYYCGKPCDSWAGNPSVWPVGYPHKEEPGVVKWHHMGCLLKNLNLLQEAKNIIDILLADNFTKPIRSIANQWLEDYNKLNNGE